MGQSHSSQSPKDVPIEQLGHELALKFASKCFTHLEIAHFKDNFKALADHQDDVEYWKEDTLGRFLCLPEPLHAGPVIYQMCTYLGAFPFPALAPCILTREAMVKIVTLSTDRYKKVLKRGSRDKSKLLFRSLAVFDRRTSIASPSEKPSMKDIIQEQKPDDMIEEEASLKDLRSHVAGFAIDEPANDDEEEDEDDLALAALDALDAIEVFKQDQKVDRKINHALIPAENLKKLIMLMLLFGNLEPQSSISSYGDDLNDTKVKALEEAAAAMVAAFDPDPVSNGIRYGNFVKTVTITMPDLFEPLSPLFEHFLFSKNINLSKHRDTPDLALAVETAKQSPIYRAPDDTTSSSLLTDCLLSQLSASIKLLTPTSAVSTIYSSHARFNEIYSTSSSGTSLSSFSRQVFSWDSATLILISGTYSSLSTPVLLGAYLPHPWIDSSQTLQTSNIDPSTLKHAAMFQLLPRHAIFPANPYNKTTPLSHFSSKTGIALGCVIPTQSRIQNSTPLPPVLGPVSLSIDDDISTATFQHDGDLGSGAFVADPGLELAQRAAAAASSSASPVQPKKITFDIDALEVWGISFPSQDEDGEDEVTKQKKKLAWEEAEAARRRGVNFGGDKDGARALLEMAGLVGDHANGGRSGGSV